MVYYKLRYYLAIAETGTTNKFNLNKYDIFANFSVDIAITC